MKIAALSLLAVLALPAFAGTPGNMAPATALDRLMAGNQRFVAGESERPNQSVERRKEVAKGQKPIGIIVTCSDSRLSPELLFDQGLGDLFVVRNAGNTIEPRGMGSVEFAVKALGARLIMVVGHSKCGAVEGALAGGKLPGHIEDAVAPIRPAAKHAKGEGTARLNDAIRNNVRHVAGQLARDKDLQKMIASGEVKIVGATYDLESGKVEPVGK
jgi:carbonic anhydrase